MTRLVWYDEITTDYISKLPAMENVMSAVSAGVDSQPPVLYLLTRASFWAFGTGSLPLRLPQILGYWVMCICLFVFIRRCANALYAAAGVVFLLIISSFSYAYEARPYGILLGLTGTSLLSWQYISRGENRTRTFALVGLTLSLIAAVSTHYFAVLLWIPLGLGELARSWDRKKIDFTVWAAMLLGLAPLIAYWPLLTALKASIGQNYWSRPSLRFIEDAYRDYFTLAFAPLLAAILVWGLFAFGKRRSEASLRMPIHEQIAVVALAGLPVFGVIMSFVAGGFAPRYALPCIAGVAVLLVTLGYSRTNGSPVLGCVLLGVFLGWYCLKAPSTYKFLAYARGAGATAPAAPFDNTEWTRFAQASSLPLVATDHIFYMQQLQYYPPPQLAPRLYYVADVASALKYDHFTTSDVVMLLSRRFFPVKVEEYKPFLAAHPHFLVAALTTKPNWIVTRLKEEGATLKLRAREGDYMLFEVETAQP